ncbi:transcription initiation factor TFIID subunit 4 isoform X2 [Bemisia tabaci]|uniref:transcription initiation factor TFIID subunit 4 isoform X2 n=1 Tax=Bemisia tabaci TaxID=7038 RepID=UPI003B28BC52
MASVKFLEDADHVVSNGATEAMSIIINSNSSKPIITNSHQSANVLPSNILTTLSSQNVSNSNQNSFVSQFTPANSNLNKTQSVGMDQAKPTGTALVIKTHNNGNHNSIPTTQGLVSAPMTANSTSMPTIVANSSHIIPANLGNVQFVNVNAIRANQPGQKTITQRVMIPQMMGTRQGTPGGQIALQAIPGLAGASGSHILVKTENGQIQLLRVAAGPATPNAPIAANHVTSTGNQPSFRIQTVVTQAITGAAVQTAVPPLTTVPSPSVQPQPVAKSDTTKEKCRKFLANLLELSSREPKPVERNVRKLIQELVDMKVEPEEFCDRLEKLLNASPQPCLIGFLKKNLPLLRQSMIAKELVIDGIRPPPPSVLYTQQQQQQQQHQTTPVSVVQQVQVANTQATNQIRTAVPASVTPQMRIIAQPAQATVRTVATAQQRLVTPARVQTPITKIVGTSAISVGAQSTVPTNATMTNCLPSPRVVTPMRPPVVKAVPVKTLPTQMTIRPTIAVAATTTTTKQSIVGRLQPVTAATPISKPQAPSLTPKPAVTTKKEKAFSAASSSSASYAADDDINDVAAMGGVNLAEETQRILGSTEFVGTQIRSCKDDLYLHSQPLMKKIKEIASQHGLDEPSPEVAAIVSHATQERLRNLVEKLAVIAEHRIDLNKADWRYEVSQDVRGQLKFLEELDRVERRRHDEVERELLLRAAKSRSKSEDPEQAKLKAKAKEMQRAEMEELRQREANFTALQAIGPRKKPKLEVPTSASNGSSMAPGSDSSQISSSSVNRPQLASRPRLKRVNIRDFLFLLEQEKETCHSQMLFQAYLK